jgi:hypothetical protein
MASERCWWTKKKEKRKMGREAAHHPPKKLRRKREQRKRGERSPRHLPPRASATTTILYDVNSRDTTKKPASHKIIFASIDIDHQLIVTAPFITTKNQQ